MKMKKSLILILLTITISLVASGCSSDCEMKINYPIDVYRVPDASAPVWGVESGGITRPILARTADGWVGYDPGYAQAGNIGLAHHRYFQLNAIVTPNCLSSVPLVTIADVEADIAASGGP